MPNSDTQTDLGVKGLRQIRETDATPLFYQPIWGVTIASGTFKWAKTQAGRSVTANKSLVFFEGKAIGHSGQIVGRCTPDSLLIGQAPKLGR